MPGIKVSMPWKIGFKETKAKPIRPGKFEPQETGTKLKGELNEALECSEPDRRRVADVGTGWGVTTRCSSTHAFNCI